VFDGTDVYFKKHNMLIYITTDTYIFYIYDSWQGYKQRHKCKYSLPD
jgi:hypothetical protein